MEKLLPIANIATRREFNYKQSSSNVSTMIISHSAESNTLLSLTTVSIVQLKHFSKVYLEKIDSVSFIPIVWILMSLEITVLLWWNVLMYFFATSIWRKWFCVDVYLFSNISINFPNWSTNLSLVIQEILICE